MGELLDSLMKSAEEENSSQPKKNESLTQKPNIEKKSTTPVNVKVKKGSKLSVKGFLIGCGIFGLLFVLIILISLYYFISNPSVLKSIGLEVDTAKSLLTFFVVIFFGLIFFVGFFVSVVNMFRLFSAKEGKAKFYGGLVIGIIFLLFSITLGTISIFQINKIAGTTTIKTNNLVNLFLITKEKNILLLDQVVPVAPSYVLFDLNRDLFRSQILSKLSADIKINGLELDCGNGQQLFVGPIILTSKDEVFGECLFLKKGDYNLNLKYKFLKDSQEYEEILSLGKIVIKSEIELKLGGGVINLNDNKTEIVAGNSPVKVMFNSNKMFSDLGLEKNEIERDFNSDGKIDIKDKSNNIFEYKESQLYNIYYKLPKLIGYEDTNFLFKIRVGEDELNEDCKVNVIKKTNIQYLANLDLGNNGIDVKAFTIKLMNSKNDQVLDKQTTSQPQTIFNNLTEGGSYYVIGEFINKNGKKTNCKSNIFQTNFGDVAIKYDLLGKESMSKAYKKIEYTGLDQVYVISKYPYYLKLNIKDIAPYNQETDTISFYINDNEIIEDNSEKKSYEFNIEENKTYEGKIEIKSDEKVKYSEKFKIIIQELALEAILITKPTFGKEPLEVVFDASTSKINEDNDEIIYFTWDFGDGEILKKTNQGKISHTYKFREQGDYEAKVTIISKNKHESTAIQKIAVQREIKQAKIQIEPPHSNQVAKTLETINFNLEIDGNIKSIIWDFGNGKKISGDGRQYSSVSTTYNTVGTYIVKAIVEIEDLPSTTSTLKIKIIE